MIEWKELEIIARNRAITFGDAYVVRLDFEVNEINKQALNQYWIDLYEEEKKFKHNKNGLVMPFLLGITNVDPIVENIKSNVEYQPDFPDIDLDFLPMARDPIKEYIANKYGSDKVCSVGSWLTYKPRLAIKDAARVLPCPDSSLTDKQFMNRVYEVLDSLPKEFDDLQTKPYNPEEELEIVKNEFPSFKDFADSYPELVGIAYRMVTRIKTQGKHAGGLIISSVPIGDYVPLTYDHKTGQHVSSWTEGFNQQLSKFGFVKFDLLGLRTMQDIHVASRYINENRGVEFDWQHMSPQSGVIGRWKEKDGEWQDITMDDSKILDLANKQRVETVFQFETDFAMSILKEVGIKSFWDIVAATSLGRPGPMEQIPFYVKNRDDPKKNWKTGLPDELIKILDPTHGVIIFQEQLQQVWTEMCGLSIPEAEQARKAVAKKKSDQLLKLEPRVVAGMAKYKDEDFAKEWWEKMTKFGRYAFNRSHAAAYCVISWRCLFLKAHFPVEWWASVLSHTKPDRRAKYIGLARLEDIEFGTVNINNLREDFYVDGDKILPGLKILKGVGKRGSEQLTSLGKTDFKNVDEFIEAHSITTVGDDGKEKIKRLVNKSIMKRLVKLGAFDRIHSNRKALWYYYVYKYASHDDTRRSVLKKIKSKFGWSQEEIEAERKKMALDYKKNPKNTNRKIPKRIAQWKPKVRTFELGQFEELVPNDYSLDDMLNIEKEHYGFYWHSPMDLYMHDECTIETAKETGILECVIQDKEISKTTRGTSYFKITVTDGLEEARLMVFSDQINASDPKLFNDGVGIRVEVNWSENYRSFSCKRGKQIVGLIRKDVYESFYSDDDIQDKDDDLEEIDEVDIEEDGLSSEIESIED